MKSTRYGGILGTLIKNVKSQSFDFFLNKKKIDIIILKFRLFKSLKARLPFVQSDVFCTLYICSAVAKGYRGEDQALAMNRKVGEGEAFGVDMKDESLQK